MGPPQLEDNGLQIEAYLLHRRVPVSAGLGQKPLHERIQALRQAHGRRRDRPRFLGGDPKDQFRSVFRVEWAYSGYELIKHNTIRPYIALSVSGVARELLRRHVL